MLRMSMTLPHLTRTTDHQEYINQAWRLLLKIINQLQNHKYRLKNQFKNHNHWQQLDLPQLKDSFLVKNKLLIRSTTVSNHKRKWVQPVLMKPSRKNLKNKNQKTKRKPLLNTREMMRKKPLSH